MKVFLTGASGYVARVTLPYLFQDEEISAVSGLDIRPPSVDHPKFNFVKGDVRSADWEGALNGIDVVAHLAFIVTEIWDKKKIYDINVNGTRRVLEAVNKAGIRRLVVASSASAYGSHPRKGEIITEETPCSGNTDSYYAHTKHLIEAMLDEFEEENPDVTVTRLRPTILCGAQTDNFFLDLLKHRLILYPTSNPEGLPLVYEQDAGKAFYLAIKKGIPGIFNIAAGNLSFRTIGSILGKPTFGCPYLLLKYMTDIGYFFGISPFSSHWVTLGRYPISLSTEKAKEILGWTPQCTPEEAFREMLTSWKTR
ncbi:MAG TPA: NAD-dependent epimerase/dehydratase family protein [Candidatus Hydrogenedentes bacterium]|nr:NAD-dependent epimerase/dehydratase family protein [Candidatus Hydrogenedentota bacterium]